MEESVAEIKRIENGKYKVLCQNPCLNFSCCCSEYKKVVVNKQKMSEKKSENEMVMAEFKMLDDDANVFKMVGPILAKQSVFECKDVVTQRIAFIEQKVANLETLENEFQKKIAEKQNGIKTLQQ